MHYSILTFRHAKQNKEDVKTRNCKMISDLTEYQNTYILLCYAWRHRRSRDDQTAFARVSKSEAFSSSLALLLAILLNVRLTNTALSTALMEIAMMYPSLEAFS